MLRLWSVVLCEVTKKCDPSDLAHLPLTRALFVQPRSPLFLLSTTMTHDNGSNKKEQRHITVSNIFNSCMWMANQVASFLGKISTYC